MSIDTRRVVIRLVCVAAVMLLVSTSMEWVQVERRQWEDVALGFILVTAAVTPLAMLRNEEGRDVIRLHVPGSYFTAVGFAAVCATAGLALIAWGREALQRAIGA